MGVQRWMIDDGLSADGSSTVPSSSPSPLVADSPVVDK